MQKTIITVPRGIRYIGQWQGFQLNNFPAKCIINKVLPGCGFTRYCIESNFENVILCSPRKMLLQNKYEQHKLQTYLVVNELEQDPGVDMDITKERKIIEDDTPDKNYTTQVKAKLHKELREYMFGKAQWKILVTYDSFRILKEVLQEMQIFDRFYVVVDEMQAIMQDARFKSSTEINFLSHLQDSHSALFVSATPMLEEYLDELPEFKDLQYFEFDWKSEDWTRITKPNLDVRRMTSISSEAESIIDKFKSGDYDSIDLMENGIPVKKLATELVFYLNSVNAIVGIISKNGLKDSEVNILCSNTEENQKKIWKRLGKRNGYKIGRVPIKGESRKPFTFCTRTVYLGADFYSDCAKSYIFSDANSDYLSVDISMDLPQILGRQRCDENPWKNSATFFYKATSDLRKMTREDFNKRIQEKDQATSNLLFAWNNNPENVQGSLSFTYLKAIKYAHYKDDYVALNKQETIGSDGNKVYRQVPVVNHLVKISEKRAFDIQQVDYADRFSVFMTLSDQFSEGFSEDSSESDPVEMQVKEFFRVYEQQTQVSGRLRMLCEVPLTDRAREMILNQIPVTDKAKYFYQAAGPERCKADAYILKRISESIGVKFFNRSELAAEIYKEFQENTKLSLSEIKSKLKDIYQRIGYDKTPKAIDISGFFNISEYTFVDKTTKKRVRGYELIKKLL